jgi:hypothetical protein
MAQLYELLVKLEPVLLLVAAVALVRSGSARKYPALCAYFAIRGAMLLILESVLWNGMPANNGSVRFEIYYLGFYVNCLVVSIAIFFVMQEIFKRVMEPVPGLRRLGLLAFRWVSIASAVVSIGAIAVPIHSKTPATSYFCAIGPNLMRCASIMELCLVAFLGLSIHTLGRSFRSRLFGVALGFGLQAAMDMLNTALVVKYPGLSSPVNYATQIVTSIVLVTWAAYFLIPEPAAERSMIVLPPTSAMARWNALAKGIGQTPETAVATPTTGFFLQDIEGVVDRVLAKNPVVVSR